MATFEASGVTASGALVKLLWKAWRPHDMHDQVRLELKRVLPPCGYPEVSPNTKAHLIVKDQLPKWRQVWLRLHFIERDMWGRSRHSSECEARHRGEGGGGQCEQEYWLSVSGLLSCLIFWASSRKSLQDRQRCKLVLRLFLEGCCAADCVLSMAVRDIDGDIMASCDKRFGGGFACPCIERALAVDQPGLGAHDDAIVAMPKLFAETHCDAVALHWHNIISSLSCMISEDFESWGRCNLQCCPQLALAGPSGKRRSVDPHVRALAAGDVLEGQAADGGIGVAGCGYSDDSIRKWATLHCCEVQAQGHLSLATTQAFSASFDGARIGKAAQELLITILGDPLRGRWVTLPPAVLSVRVVHLVWMSGGAAWPLGMFALPVVSEKCEHTSEPAKQSENTTV